MGQGYIDLTLDDRALGSSAGRTRGILDRISHASVNLDRHIRRLGLGLAALGTGSVIAFGRFEKVMAGVGAISEATRGEFEAMEETARELGRTTMFSASQSAQAMEYLALAGFKAQEIVTALPHALNLAAAGQLDMATAAQISARIIRGLGHEASDLGHDVDVLAKAFTSSQSDLYMLGEAYKFAGAVAKGAGKDIEEVTAVLQAFHDVGIQAGMAGRSFRMMLQRLSAQPAAVKKTLNLLGIEIADSSGKMLHFADIIDAVNRATANMTETQRLAVAANLAGTRAMSGFIELMSLGGDTIREYEAALIDSEGHAKKIAETRMDTLWGAWKRIISAAESFAIDVGKAFAKVDERGRSTADFLVELFGSGGYVVKNWKDTWEIIKLSAAERLMELGDSARGALIKIAQTFQLMGEGIIAVFEDAMKGAATMWQTLVAGAKWAAERANYELEQGFMKKMRESQDFRMFLAAITPGVTAEQLEVAARRPGGIGDLTGAEGPPEHKKPPAYKSSVLEFFDRLEKFEFAQPKESGSLAGLRQHIVRRMAEMSAGRPRTPAEIEEEEKKRFPGRPPPGEEEPPPGTGDEGGPRMLDVVDVWRSMQMSILKADPQLAVAEKQLVAQQRSNELLERIAAEQAKNRAEGLQRIRERERANLEIEGLARARDPRFPGDAVGVPMGGFD